MVEDVPNASHKGGKLICQVNDVMGYFYMDKEAFIKHLIDEARKIRIARYESK